MISYGQSVTYIQKLSVDGQCTSHIPTVTKKEDYHSDNEKVKVNTNAANSENKNANTNTGSANYDNENENTKANTDEIMTDTIIVNAYDI